MSSYSMIDSWVTRPSWARPRWRRMLTSVGLVACALAATVFLAVPARAQGGPIAPTGMRPIQVAFDNSNFFGVLNGASSPSFNVPFPKVYVVQQIWTYHWNGGFGDSPGQIAIQDGHGIVTRWNATNATPGSNPTGWLVYEPQDLNGGPYLMAYGNGPYRVLDSNPNTWSWNSQSQAGFYKIWIY